MRLRRLDILRGVAVLLVLFRHATPPEPEVAAPVRKAAEVLADVGWIGVDLFFVLSGFLVAGLLFAEYRSFGAPARLRFWLRRGFKIYPAFYVVILVTWWMQTYADAVPFTPSGRLVHEMLHVQNYREGFWNHTWSLAVEEHFYLALPLLLALMAGAREADPFRRSWVVLPILAGAVLLWRVASVHTPMQFQAYLFATHLRVDSLLWGVLLAYVFHYRDRAWLGRLRAWWPATLVVIALLLAPPYLFRIGESVGLATYGLTTIALGFTLLLALTLATATLPAPRRSRVLSGAGTMMAAIGVDSYSIYLWHMPVQRWAMPWIRNGIELPGSDPTHVFVRDLGCYLTIAVVGGMTAARLVERPALALRDRWLPARAYGLESGGRAAPSVELVAAQVDARS